MNLLDRLVARALARRAPTAPDPEPEPVTVVVLPDTSGFTKAVDRAGRAVENLPPAGVLTAPDHDPQEPAARAPATPETINAPKATPAPQPRTPEPPPALSAPPAPAARKKIREFIPALTSHGHISALCDTGRHYECTGCRCGCHPPLTTWST